MTLPVFKTARHFNPQDKYTSEGRVNILLWIDGSHDKNDPKTH